MAEDEKKVVELTDADLARIPGVRDKWIAIGLCTDPADWESAEAGAEKAYATASLDRPTLKLRTTSPYAGCVTSAMLVAMGNRCLDEIGGKKHPARERSQPLANQEPINRVAFEIGSQLGDQVVAAFLAAAPAALGADAAALAAPFAGEAPGRTFRSDLEKRLGPAIRRVAEAIRENGDDLRPNLATWYGTLALPKTAEDAAAFHAKVRDRSPSGDPGAVLAVLGERMKVAALDAMKWAANVIDDDAVRDQLSKAVYGQHDASWLSFYDFFKGLIEEVDQIDGLSQVAQASCWWWPYRGAVVLTDRPAEIHLEDTDNGNRRLHCETGPALRFRDGWCLWRINGVAVTEQIVMRPESQTIADIRAEQNVEVRRIRIERYGWQRYLAEIDAKTVEVRHNHVECTKEGLLKTPEGENVLVMACPSTARTYAQRVGDEVKSCEEAQLWLSGGLSGRTINAA